MTLAPKEDKLTVEDWQSADSLRKLVNTTSSSLYYFEREGKLLNGKYRVERREQRTEEGEVVTEFRAVEVEDA